jgi:hypothetical protein
MYDLAKNVRSAFFAKSYIICCAKKALRVFFAQQMMYQGKMEQKEQ